MCFSRQGLGVGGRRGRWGADKASQRVEGIPAIGKTLRFSGFIQK